MWSYDPRISVLPDLFVNFPGEFLGAVLNKVRGFLLAPTQEYYTAGRVRLLKPPPCSATVSIHGLFQAPLVFPPRTQNNQNLSTATLFSTRFLLPLETILVLSQRLLLAEL